jgi:hypothetical protein
MLAMLLLAGVGVGGEWARLAERLGRRSTLALY